MQAKGTIHNTGSPSGDRANDQLAARERRAGPTGMAEGLAVLRKPDFGVIPSPESDAQPEKQGKWANIDAERLARAKALGQIALERRASQPLEDDELERLVRKGQT